ncbi:hypothetical protein HFO74_19495 [Rhizobium laguerreae]|uniref:Uncharacterized protein n=1 Tax=Rhizobium laguerreae TaxID=1076926 RepID=A0AAJ3A670_9HYPH|nr:DUF6428 family protein [Rhizobium laguerreae]MBY3065579.1 hypothetical protein [Rhizobium laguerreae]MBY3076555.1 hypothetical protein [Rhizobium laguerreae]MBY3111586.1 hypothetical protein [Rhizobium laguerreae]MBY3241517.1 hypothetical protein [Rhizobium laguerreae]MBY3303167.1 hypothetical protein [Rhizobium laguerreae]
MNVIDNSKIQEDDIDLGLLLSVLAGAKASPLIFYYDGKAVKPGYHVTEVKAGQFSGLDCGANPEAWAEIFIQLWDIEEGDRTHMPAGKFHSIIRKVTEHVQLDRSAKLTFEVSDGVRPMQLYCAAMPVLSAGAVHVTLWPRPASCKPRDRWLAEETSKAAACCAPQAATSGCCA